MNFEYSRANVAQGRFRQQKQQEEPTTFGRTNSAEDFTTGRQLDRPRQRMAGQYGERLMEYLENPEEQERTDQWNNAFSMSNEGSVFNQAKMNGGMQPEEGDA